mmetsp:Transcript_683/g.1023  ORF Transcript_683/g.1023 Transcript_683/m.1023 type:complete len:257 (-) Transcript_683:474-1244(-)
MAACVSVKQHKSLFRICQRSFASDKPRRPRYGASFFAFSPSKDYNTDLMKSVQQRANTAKHKTMNKLRKQRQIQLPKASTASSSNDVLNGSSKLSSKFNQDSDVYIRANTAFVNRKYEPLSEQVSNMTESFAALKRKRKIGADAANMEMQDSYDYGQLNRMGKHSHDQMKNKAMKLHEQWNYFFQGVDGCLFTEAETWNVIAHINKRHSYGKSLRYSDRFYRNWAIQLAQEEDTRFQATRRDYNQRENMSTKKDWK